MRSWNDDRALAITQAVVSLVVSLIFFHQICVTMEDFVFFRLIEEFLFDFWILVYSWNDINSFQYTTCIIQRKRHLRRRRQFTSSKCNVVDVFSFAHHCLCFWKYACVCVCVCVFVCLLRWTASNRHLVEIVRENLSLQNAQTFKKAMQDQVVLLPERPQGGQAYLLLHTIKVPYSTEFFVFSNVQELSYWNKPKTAWRSALASKSKTSFSDSLVTAWGSVNEATVYCCFAWILGITFQLLLLVAVVVKQNMLWTRQSCNW